MSRPWRYMEIDSTYRNRKEYPNPAYFVIQVGGSRNANSFTALDPVIDAYPFASGVTDILSTATDVILGPTASSINNFYVDDILQIGNQFRRVISYDGSTTTATVDTAFTIPTNAVPWQMRRGTPIYSGVLGIGSSQSSVVLAPSPPAIAPSPGNYIYIPLTGEVARVNTYDPITFTATVSPFFSAAFPAGTAYEILTFSYDNYNPLTYNGSRTQQEVCYEMKLESLVLPNQEIFTGTGGNLISYPYLFVQFSTQSGSKNTLWTNNPNTINYTFKVIVDLDTVLPPFLRLTKSSMIQTIKFRPTDFITFSVRLPNGELVVYSPDDMSPLPPNRFKQISATFAMRRVDTPS